MKLVLVRHGDPDYKLDSLTEKGWKEAELLASHFLGKKIDYVYCSPLGRAAKTCETVQKKCGFCFETLPWLREFSGRFWNPCFEKETIPWDLYPSFFDQNPSLRKDDEWLDSSLFQDSNMKDCYEEVKVGLLRLLEKHGYRKEGSFFRVEKKNEDTLVLFCHFGVIAVMLSVLTGFSPYVFWQYFCALPTSVTTIVSEEREEGIASFRCIGFGDLSHLALGKEEPSFAARFQEIYQKED